MTAPLDMQLEHLEPYNLGIEIPKLQNTDQYHLFVASSSHDWKKVSNIVEELENQFGIKCLFASRDFKPGNNLTIMIPKGIDVSFKVVLMFSPNFVESTFCQLETEQAYYKMTARGNGCVIPVLLENCDVPETMKPRTYIDATLPGMDVRAVAIKIAQALVRIESPANIIPFKFTKSDTEDKNQNGTFVDISAVKGLSRKCSINMSPYQFYLRRNDMAHLKAKEINVNSELLRQTMALLNEHTVTRRYHLLNWHWPWVIGLITCPCTVFACLAIFLGKLWTMSTEYQSEEVAAFVRTGHWVAWIPFAIFAAITIPLLVLKYAYKRNVEKGVSDIRCKLWDEITSLTLKDGVVFSILFRKSPVLYIMMLLNDNEADKKTSQEREAIADGFVLEHLKNMCTSDNNIDVFRKADYNRHAVFGSRMCICQKYESMSQ